MNRIHN